MNRLFCYSRTVTYRSPRGRSTPPTGAPPPSSGGEFGARLVDPRRVLMDDHLSTRKGGHDVTLDLVGDLVRAPQAHVAVHLEMDLDEHGQTGRAGPEVMH